MSTRYCQLNCRHLGQVFSKGFTLAELLIALAILGVISSFTIPKIVFQQQAQQKSAVFRESISTVSDLAVKGLQSGELIPSTNMGSYFTSHLNAVKICASDSVAEGCWNTTLQGNNTEKNEPGVILPNGASLVGFGNTTNPENGVMIDSNGTQGPNIAGDDQLYLGFCLIQGACGPGWLNGSGPRWPGAIGVDRAGTSADLALYQSLFQ